MPDISATLPVIVAGRPPKELSGFDADMSEPAERQRERLDRINDDDPQYKERQRNRSSAAESHNNGDSQASSETAQAEPLFGRRAEDRAGDSARQDFNDHRRGRGGRNTPFPLRDR